MLVPERNMTWKSPLFWAVLCGVCYMHYYNGQEAEKEEVCVRKRRLCRLLITSFEMVQLFPVMVKCFEHEKPFDMRGVICSSGALGLYVRCIV